MLIQSALKDGGKQLKLDLFSQFNGMPEEANYDWYQFDGYWQNRMIHGDGKRVMASLAEREGLAGKVQTVYMDPPYNIKFNANFQLKTDEIEVGESGDELPHDPMAVKAFRDTYSGNIHTFLDNLHEQMTLARELLTESGSCFVQIGYENVHEVACLMNEVFGKENHVATIPYITATKPKHKDDSDHRKLDPVVRQKQRTSQVRTTLRTSDQRRKTPTHELTHMHNV